MVFDLSIKNARLSGDGGEYFFLMVVLVGVIDGVVVKREVEDMI